MSNFSHNANIKYLLEINAISDRSTAFDYSGLDLEESLDFIFNNMQKNLIEDENIIKNTVLLFFRNDFAINARATKEKDWATIFITSGTLVELNRIFGAIKNSKGFEHSDHLVQFLYSTVIMFIYYHEKAHHIQNIKNFQFEANEIIQNVNTKFSTDRNLKEFDADIYAASYVCNAIQIEWQNNNLKAEVLIEWAGIFSAGMYWFFVRTSVNFSQFYTYLNDHPHGIIRAHYILDRVTKFFISNANFNYIQCNGIIECFKTYVQLISNIDTKVDYEFFLKTINESTYSIQNYITFLENKHDRMENAAITRDPRLLIK